jgi:hypothetical protein
MEGTPQSRNALRKDALALPVLYFHSSKGHHEARAFSCDTGCVDHEFDVRKALERVYCIRAEI